MLQPQLFKNWNRSPLHFPRWANSDCTSVVLSPPALSYRLLALTLPPLTLTLWSCLLLSCLILHPLVSSCRVSSGLVSSSLVAPCLICLKLDRGVIFAMFLPRHFHGDHSTKLHTLIHMDMKPQGKIHILRVLVSASFIYAIGTKTI